VKGQGVAIPDFQSMMRPMLEVHADGRSHSQAEIRDLVAAAMGVPEDDRKVLLPSGKQTTYANRIAWAGTHMAQAGLLERPMRGFSQITARGQQVLRDHPKRVDLRVLFGFPDYVEFRKPARDRLSHTVEQPIEAALAEPGASPDEAIRDLIDSSHAAVAAELLSRIIKQPPEFLERLVLDLLTAMGYGGLAEHLGGPGDQGLDGIIRLDRLGLDVVYVQAKRYTDSVVGRPDIQGFAGALQGAQASRGIFITTSRFSADAKDFADRIQLRLILIDGPELAKLMIEHNCGVATQQTFTLKQLDENYFGDE
jgi:restriction system protein